MFTVAELIIKVARYSREPFNGTTALQRNEELKNLAQMITSLSSDDIVLVDALIDKSFKSGSWIGVQVVKLLLESLTELPDSFIKTSIDAALSDIYLAENTSPQTIDLLVARTSFDHVTWLLIEILESKDEWRQSLTCRCILFLLGLLDDLAARPRNHHQRLEDALLGVVEKGCQYETALGILRDVMSISPSTYQRLRPCLQRFKSPLLFTLLAAKGNDLVGFLESAAHLFVGAQAMTLIRRVNRSDDIYALSSGFYNIGPYAPKDYDLAWLISNEEAFVLLKEPKKSSVLKTQMRAIHERPCERSMPPGYVEL